MTMKNVGKFASEKEYQRNTKVISVRLCNLNAISALSAHTGRYLSLPFLSVFSLFLKCSNGEANRKRVLCFEFFFHSYTVLRARFKYEHKNHIVEWIQLRTTLSCSQSERGRCFGVCWFVVGHAISTATFSCDWTVQLAKIAFVCRQCRCRSLTDHFASQIQTTIQRAQHTRIFRTNTGARQQPICARI